MSYRDEYGRDRAYVRDRSPERFRDRNDGYGRVRDREEYGRQEQYGRNQYGGDDDGRDRYRESYGDRADYRDDYDRDFKRQRYDSRSPGSYGSSFGRASLNLADRPAPVAADRPAYERAFEQTGVLRFKSKLCKPFEETGRCRYGSSCNFAHGAEELSGGRTERDAFKDDFLKKTRMCRHFVTQGVCPFGDTCGFAHGEDELRRRPGAMSGGGGARGGDGRNSPS